MLPDAAGAAAHTGASFYVWESPGAEGVVHLSLDFVDRLNAVILQNFAPKAGRQLEIGGILLGAIEAGERAVTLVQDFQVLSCDHGRGASWTLSPKDRLKLSERLRRRQWPAPLEPVGCFRTHTRPGLYLDQDDFGLFSQYFSDPRQAFLLVRPAAGATATAGFFVWDEGDVRRQSTYLAFPFDAAQLNSGAHPVVSRRPASPRLAPPPTPVAHEPVPVPLIPPGWRMPAAAAAALLAVAGLYQWITPHLTRSARPAPQALSLRVERTGGALRLVWDRQSAVVRKARAAIVNISEGQSRLRIDLNAQQLASGSVMYFPQSPDINFDMELRGPAVNVSESVRAVVPLADLPLPAPLDARLLEPVPGMPPESAPPRAASQGTADRKAEPAREELRRLAYVPPARPRAPLPAIDAPPALAAAIPAPPPLAPPRPRNVTVTYEPAAPSRFSRVIGRIPLVRTFRDAPVGKDFVPAAPLRVPKPVVPPGLAPGEPVALKVLIDEAGWVMRAEPVSNASLASRFAAGAPEWRFIPARLNGKPVASEMLMQFKFDP